VRRRCFNNEVRYFNNGTKWKLTASANTSFPPTTGDVNCTEAHMKSVAGEVVIQISADGPVLMPRDTDQTPADMPLLTSRM